MGDLGISLNNTLFGPTTFRQQGLADGIYTVFATKVVTDLGITYQAAEKVELRSGELMYCGMIQGKKVIRGGHQTDGLEQGYEIEFLPHESFVLAPSTTIEIDFPDAKISQPTRCLTVEIEADRISRIAKTLLRGDGLCVERFDCHGDQSSVFHTCHTEGTQLL